MEDTNRGDDTQNERRVGERPLVILHRGWHVVRRHGERTLPVPRPARQSHDGAIDLSIKPIGTAQVGKELRP